VLILPSQFLYTAERSGLILEIDRWVLGEAIRRLGEAMAEALRPLLTRDGARWREERRAKFLAMGAHGL